MGEYPPADEYVTTEEACKIGGWTLAEYASILTAQGVLLLNPESIDDRCQELVYWVGDEAVQGLREGGRLGAEITNKGGLVTTGTRPVRGPRVADKIGEALGVSGRTYSRAKEVVEATESTKPESSRSGERARRRLRMPVHPCTSPVDEG